MPRISIVGHPFDVISRSDFLEVIQTKLTTNFHQFTLSFANPEHVITFRAHKDIQRYTHNCLYCVADGMGIVWASRILQPLNKRIINERITGTDFAYDIARICSANKLRLFIFGGKEENNVNACKNLKQVYTDLQVSGMNGWNHSESEVIKTIQSFRADVVMVCLYNGMQERWIETHKNNLPGVRLLFGNGGAVDFLAGKRKRAPEWMHNFAGMGLEWLWRLSQDFTWKKIKQVMKVPYFMILVFFVRIGLLRN